MANPNEQSQIEQHEMNRARVREILADYNIPSLNLAYEESRRMLDIQLGQVDAICTKASVIIAGSGIVLTVLFSSLPSLNSYFDSLAVILTVLAISSGLVSIILGMAAIAFAEYDTVPSIERLKEYLTWEEAETKYVLLSEFRTAFENRKKVIDQKIRLARYSLYTFVGNFSLSCLTLFYLLLRMASVSSH